MIANIESIHTIKLITLANGMRKTLTNPVCEPIYPIIKNNLQSIRQELKRRTYAPNK